MTTSFRSPFKVIRRSFGYWQAGVYHPSDETGTEMTVQATVQIPTQSDLNKIEAMALGIRNNRFIKIYCDTRLGVIQHKIDGLRQEHPGDIFCYDNSQYLICAEHDFTALNRTRSSRVCHWRYYAYELIEGFAMENVA